MRWPDRHRRQRCEELRERCGAATIWSGRSARLALGRGGPRDLAGAARTGWRRPTALRCRPLRDELALPADRRSWRSSPAHRSASTASSCALDAGCRRCSAATAASCRRASTPNSTSCARCATRAASSDRRARGPADRARPAIGSLKIRHNEVLRLLHRDHARAATLPARTLADFVHRQTMADADALHHRRAGRARDARSLRPPSGRWPSSSSSSRNCASACWPTARPSPRRPRALAALDLTAALADWRGERRYCRPDRRRQRACSRSRRPPSGGRAAAAAAARASSPTTATSGRRRRALAASPARTWPARSPSCARTR